MADEGAATATGTEGTEGNTGTEEQNTGTENGTETQTGNDDKPLGPEGEKALSAFKDRARTAEREAKELKARLDKIEEANKTDSEKAIDAAKKEGRTEAESEFEKERRADRLQVAVAGHARELADVDDVVLNLERGDVDGLFDDDGKIDKTKLKSSLEDLLKAKPHLKAGGDGKPRGNANGGEGAGNESTSFNDLLRR